MNFVHCQMPEMCDLDCSDNTAKFRIGMSNELSRNVGFFGVCVMGESTVPTVCNERLQCPGYEIVRNG